MSDMTVRFSDGAAYEEGMGRWSRPVGEIFLDWLAPPAGWRWLDVGCGSGAFTELLVQRCAPAETVGVDPSEAQLAFARNRPGASGTMFQSGNAMALPFEDGRFDAAVMALVIFFVPDPAKGVAEMARVVRPGGLVASYAWDRLAGGSPFAPIQAELRAMGAPMVVPPGLTASGPHALTELWAGAGLTALETRDITVQREFADFDAFWQASTKTGTVRQSLAAMPPGEVDRLKQRVRSRVAPGQPGAITCAARAKAIRGRVPD